MAKYGGVVPPMHPVGQPILLDSWNELISLHSDKNIYQLLPRRAKSNNGYALIKSICCSAGSPFTMEHRVDTTDYKLSFRAADYDIRNQFNASNQDKVPHNIWFDGILKAPNASALISFSPTISNSHVSTLVGSHQFLREFIKQPAVGDRHRQLKELYAEVFTKPTLLFLGTTVAPGRDLVNSAKGKNVFVYCKKGRDFVYQQ
ncbi:hypothetical protein AGDE_01409 [Angomonas deanei]|nr:hypothetical protein AGDE_01409 [Angomonas deanei]|eukprot:EPY42514.1 hypothetical protein AGDE_01409 [Angomonas deanei]